MGNQTSNNIGRLEAATEQLYRELRELRAITEAGLQSLGADLSTIKKTSANTERKVTFNATWNDLKFDAITWAIMLVLVVLSQGYVSAIRNAPIWLKAILPGVAEPAQGDGQPKSKQVMAFSRPGDLLSKGSPLESTPYSISSTVGWRYVFGVKDWHEGYDVPTPLGSPLHAVLPVTVECGSSGGGGIHAVYTVGTEQHYWIHLLECTPGTYSTGDVFGKTGNTGSRTTGPHLDYRVKDVASGEWVRPYADVLRLTLNPNAEVANANPVVNAPGMVELITSFEGFHSTPYWDYQQWSWGYGTKAPGQHGRIDQAAAERELLAYLERNCLPTISPLGLAEHQIAALASFCYNVGPHQFQGSDAYRHAQAGNHQAAADALLNWTKAGGKVLPGLVTRRDKERRVYLGQ
jgi:lysozyme